MACRGSIVVVLALAMSTTGCFVGASGGMLVHSSGQLFVEEGASVGVPIRAGDFGRGEAAVEGAIGQRLGASGSSIRGGLRASYQGQPLGWRGAGLRAGWLLGVSLDALWVDDFRPQLIESIHLGATMFAPTGESRGFGLALEGVAGAAQSPDASSDAGPSLPDGVMGGVVLRAWYDIYSIGLQPGSPQPSHGAGLLGLSRGSSR